MNSFFLTENSSINKQESILEINLLLLYQNKSSENAFFVFPNQLSYVRLFYLYTI